MTDVLTDFPEAAPLTDGSQAELLVARNDARRLHRRTRAIIWSGRLLVPVVFCSVWEISGRRGWINPLFTSRPSKVGEFLREELPSAELWRNLWVTFEEALVGFGIGSALGISAGLIFIRLPLLHAIMSPYLTLMNSLPRIALAPLFVLWFGLGQQSKVVLVISLVFFIILGATLGAMGNVDPDLTRLSRVLGFPPRRTFVKVLLPWAVPGIFAGLELALVYALLGAVAGEMLAAKEGFGQQLQFYAGTLNTAALLGALTVFAVVSTILGASMKAIGRHLMRYRE